MKHQGKAELTQAPHTVADSSPRTDRATRTAISAGSVADPATAQAIASNRCRSVASRAVGVVQRGEGETRRRRHEIVTDGSPVWLKLRSAGHSVSNLDSTVIPQQASAA